MENFRLHDKIVYRLTDRWYFWRHAPKYLIAVGANKKKVIDSLCSARIILKKPEYVMVGFLKLRLMAFMYQVFI